jgi:hypothetical protein
VNNNNLNSNINLIKGIVICKDSGEYVFDLMIDSDLNPLLLSSYTGALSLFGHDNVGKIEEIIIKGDNIEMNIISNKNLVLIAILDKDLAAKYEFRNEAELLLETFYETYKDEINSVEIGKFDHFKKIIRNKINEFLEPP